MTSVALEHPGPARGERNRPAIRSPLWSAVLSALTLTIYGWWWWWKLNDELRARGEDAHPWRALTAVTVGWALIVPPFRAVRRTTEIIAAYQTQAGVVPTARSQTAIGILAAFPASLVLFFVSLWLPTGDFLLIPVAWIIALVRYEQGEFNRVVWPEMTA